MKKKQFGIVDRDIMQDPDLSLRAKGVYGLLATFAGKDRTCFPSITHLAELSGTHRRTIERILNELEAKGYVTKEDKVFTIT
jgi:DNA-binding IclR family transcriptional regulator